MCLKDSVLLINNKFLKLREDFDVVKEYYYFKRLISPFFQGCPSLSLKGIFSLKFSSVFNCVTIQSFSQGEINTGTART